MLCCSWLRHYATSIVGLIHEEVIGFFNGVDSTSDRNEYQESSWGKGQPAHKADKPTAICDLIVQKNVRALMSHNPMNFHGLLQ
jgi:hypothetical protein